MPKHDALWVAKRVASRLRISVEEYLGRIANQEKWCGRCKCFHSRTVFGSDACRADGLARYCLASARVKVKKDCRKPIRDGDKAKRQARDRIHALVQTG